MDTVENMTQVRWPVEVDASAGVNSVLASAYVEAQHGPPAIVAKPQWNWCEVCHKRQAIKTDGRSRDVCDLCARGFLGQAKGRTTLGGRNDPCPCGSGKKLKRCCGA